MISVEQTRRGFGSDNHAGVHPRVLEAIMAANVGHVPAYGADPWTARATELLREHFGADTDVALTFNGTGANIVALGAVCRQWDSVVCASTAHINSDECGAPERVAGVKLVPVGTPDGKLTPALVAPRLTGFGSEHHTQPRVISISQASEYGTIYTAEEIRALADLAHEHGMLLHVDGARLAEGAREADVTVTQAVQANEVFALLPRIVAPPLMDRFCFHVWDERPGQAEVEVRWVTSWDTTPPDVDALVEAL